MSAKNPGHCNYLCEDDIKRGPLMGYSHNIISTFYTTTSEQKTRVLIHFNEKPGKLFRIIYSKLVTSIFALWHIWFFFLIHNGTSNTIIRFFLWSLFQHNFTTKAVFRDLSTTPLGMQNLLLILGLGAIMATTVMGGNDINQSIFL